MMSLEEYGALVLTVLIIVAAIYFSRIDTCKRCGGIIDKEKEACSKCGKTLV